MWFRRPFYLLSNALGVQWRLNRRLFVWLGLFVLAGAVIGFIVCFNPKLTASSISYNLLDDNVLRVIKPHTSFGALIWGRVFGFVLVFALAFVVCLHRWTVFLIFPLAAYRGFFMIINLYWVLVKYGMVTGLILFLIYLIWFLAVLVLVLMAMVFLLRICAQVRQGGFRGGMKWREFWHGCGVFLCTIICLAFFEWFIYWLILSKIVFI